MPNLRDIQRRIKSVKNTGKITKAMQLVASSKMKKAQDLAINGRPYTQLMAQILNALRDNIDSEEIQHPLLAKREVTNRGILLIAPDKGLCGGLISNLMRMISAEGKDGIKFITIGKRATQFISRSERQLLADFPVSDKALFEELRPAIEFMLKSFIEGEIDTIEVCYTQFVNNLKQEPTICPLVPIENLDEAIEKIEAIQKYTAEAPIPNDTREFAFEPAPMEILSELLPLYIKRSIHHLFLEAKASEHSARMVAMKSATDNAKDLSDRLTLQFNKARQAAITQEILEISAATLNQK